MRMSVISKFFYNYTDQNPDLSVNPPPPPPHPQASVGGGSQFGRLEKKPSTASTLCPFPSFPVSPASYLHSLLIVHAST